MFLDNTIISAIIGATAIIVVAFISPIISKHIEGTKKEFIPEATLERKQALYGKWNGYFDQKVGEPDFLQEHKATLIFTKDDIDLNGLLTLNIGSSAPDFEATLTNTIFDGHLFRTDFVNTDARVIHFGTIYGKLSADGKNIHGRFLGYGLKSEMFVSGEIFFNYKS